MTTAWNALRRLRRQPRLLSFALLSPFLGIVLGWGKPADLPKVADAVAERFPEVREVRLAELERELEAPPGDRPILLDVRSPEEYAVSHIAGAVRVDALADALDTLRGLAVKDRGAKGGGDGADRIDRGREIVVYCAVGFRSAVLAKELQEAGYSNVRNLRGALFAWANSGRPVVRNGRRVEEVHPYDKNWGKLLREDLRAEVPSGGTGEDDPSRPAS